MIKVKIFTVCGSIGRFNNLPIEECYSIFYSLTDLDDINSCFDRIISHERSISKDRKYLGNYDTVSIQDKEARKSRIEGNWELSYHIERNESRINKSQPPLIFDGNIFWLAAVLFVDNKYTGHVYVWKYPNIELAVRVQGIRTSIDNYIGGYFKGVGKTLIDAVITFTRNKGYRYVTVWDPVSIMPFVLHKYGFESYWDDKEKFLLHNKDLTCDCMEREEYPQHKHTKGMGQYKGYTTEEYYCSDIHCEFHMADYVFDIRTMQRSNNTIISVYVIEQYLLDV